jgi:hypothetical protein
MEEDDIPDLLVLLDFEKAFDTGECSFLYKTLPFFGFGNDISSFIINNGHSSDYFKLGRGELQCDPLSPYLFILVL